MAASCLAGSEMGNELVPISLIADNPTRIDDNNGVRAPIWFESVADGGTPMCKAAGEAERIVQSWLDDHPDCFPPSTLSLLGVGLLGLFMQRKRVA